MLLSIRSSFTSSCHQRPIKNSSLLPKRRSAASSPYRFRLKNSGRQIPNTCPLSRGSISQTHLSTQGGTIYFGCHLIYGFPVRCMNVSTSVSPIDFSTQGGALDSRGQKTYCFHAGGCQDMTGLMISLSEFDAFVVLFCF